MRRSDKILVLEQHIKLYVYLDLYCAAEALDGEESV